MFFLKPLDALIPKIPFSLFAEYWVRGPGVSLGRIFRGPSIEPISGGGGSSQRAISTPPPPPLQRRKPSHPCVVRLGGMGGRGTDSAFRMLDPASPPRPCTRPLRRARPPSAGLPEHGATGALVRPRPPRAGRVLGLLPPVPQVRRLALGALDVAAGAHEGPHGAQQTRVPAAAVLHLRLRGLVPQRQRGCVGRRPAGGGGASGRSGRRPKRTAVGTRPMPILPTRRDALEGGEVPPPPFGAPSLCPATVSLTPSASLNGICNRQ